MSLSAVTAKRCACGHSESMHVWLPHRGRRDGCNVTGCGCRCFVDGAKASSVPPASSPTTIPPPRPPAPPEPKRTRPNGAMAKLEAELADKPETITAIALRVGGDPKVVCQHLSYLVRHGRAQRPEPGMYCRAGAPLVERDIKPAKPTLDRVAAKHAVPPPPPTIDPLPSLVHPDILPDSDEVDRLIAQRAALIHRLAAERNALKARLERVEEQLRRLTTPAT